MYHAKLHFFQVTLFREPHPCYFTLSVTPFSVMFHQAHGTAESGLIALLISHRDMVKKAGALGQEALSSHSVLCQMAV